MPTRNINLTPELDQFVDAKIQSGRYANASEVLRAGLRALQMDESEDEAKLLALRDALRDGIASGVAKGDAIARIRARIHKRAGANETHTA
jgi:antitoxin ParD1/3/4